MSAAENHRDGRLRPDGEVNTGLSLPSAILWSWRWRWLLGISSALFALIAAAFWLLRGESVATAMIKIPGGPTSPYGALAAQLGVTSATTAQSDPVEFYLKLLDSRALLTQVVRARYRTADNKDVSYAEAFGLQGENPGQTERRSISDLRKRIGASADNVASTITLTVSARSGVLAEQVDRYLLNAINDFNIRRRQSSARNERRFAESRLTEARGELRAAQDALEQFALGNKAFAQSAAQQAHSQRLQAEIDIRQRLVAMLEQAFEQAKLDEVRDTPVITEIDSPEGSAVRRLSLAVTVVIAALLGLVGGVAAAVGVTLAGVHRQRHPQEWAEMAGSLPVLRRRTRIPESELAD
jgi:uncharacterized protein involved in exopolysaccharide biosynthesis